jgi:Ni2+-binding GTPase involved in maturation of urease and hydrogenase
MHLADNETRVDLLNNEAIALTVIALLRERPDKPVTIGVHGDWGAGKSSVLEMIEAGLSNEQDVLCLKFNGWRFQGFEDAKIALIEGIVTGLIEKRPALTKAGVVVKDLFRRIDWLKMAKRTGGLAITAITGLPSHDQIQAAIGALNQFVENPGAIFSKENVTEVIRSAGGLLKPAEEHRNVPEEIGAFRKAFDDLLNEAKISQLVVLVDDLDRCLPDTAIETLEAIRLFVFTSRTAFVVAADEAMIEYAVRKHFPDLPDSTGPRDYARNYLEKLIQVPFRIPALGEAETRIYVTLLLIGAELDEGDAEFGKLISIARERLRRPWEVATLDAATVTATLGSKSDKANVALMLSDQVGPLLASRTNGNPRQIKRFLNSLLLRHRIAAARGFGEDIKLPALAKLMLAERFIPKLFEQIANSAANDAKGHCIDLIKLESGAEVGSAPPTKDDPQPIKAVLKRPGTLTEATPPTSSTPQESALLAEWMSSAEIREWAQLQPELGGIDLRPYLFIAKDRKDYFGRSSALGPLAAVVERLLGPKMAVQGMQVELKQLTAAESGKVFESLRSRIVGGDSFLTAPAGIDGLSVLVRAQPSLQIQLIDFLEALPADRCGPWAVAGWEVIINDAQQTGRLNALLERWSQSGSAMLKTAATGALAARKGGR